MRATLILDSSQISNLWGCQERWNNRDLVLINKLNPEDTHKPSDAISMGTLGHKLLEIYYTAICLDYEFEDAIKLALAFDPDKADSSDLDQNKYPLDPELRVAVKDRFLDYLTYVPPTSDLRPAYRKIHKVGIGKDGLLKDVWVKDPLIEKGFSYQLLNTPEYLFILEGRIDFIGHAKGGELLWMDHKFQMTKHDLYPKAIQFRNYCLATNTNLALINYIRFHKKIDATTFVRKPISFSSLELAHWKEELTEKYIEVVRNGDAAIARGDGVMPRNRAECPGSWGQHCRFIPLCDEPNAGIRNVIRNRDYTEAHKWTPWQSASEVPQKQEEGLL